MAAGLRAYQDQDEPEPAASAHTTIQFQRNHKLHQPICQTRSSRHLQIIVMVIEICGGCQIGQEYARRVVGRWTSAPCYFTGKIKLKPCTVKIRNIGPPQAPDINTI